MEASFQSTVACMLLSFERPAHRRQLPVLGTELQVMRTSLLTDLENCTVANVNGYHRVVTSVTAHVSHFGGSRKITVKIVRAHGGCLGT